MNEFEETESLSSQKAMILAHMQSGYKISGKNARRMFGCFTLAQRIYELRHKDGHVISDRLVHRYDPEGKYQGVHSEYWMPEHRNNPKD